MGTRNLTMVFVGGEYKLAQYCQWDGYPEGQGKTALTFARDEMNRERFLSALRNCREVSDKELHGMWCAVGADDSGWADMEVSGRFKELWPQLSRDTGAKILSTIQNSPDGILIYKDTNFAADSLMCEWVWVLDFDRNTFEAYKGFNKTPLNPAERFAGLPLAGDRNKDYFQVKLARLWPLTELPTDDEFLAAFKSEEDEAA